MILEVQEALRATVRLVLVEHYGLDPEALPPVAIAYPPNRALGDLAVTVAFELARVLRKAPRVIGQEIAERLAPVEGVSRVEAAPNGYVNVFLDRAWTLGRTVRQSTSAPAGAEPGAGASEKAVVEHTAINPNKAAHIGHLRNAALGDSLVRLLRYRGHRVEVQNYIDDTGVQVADVVVGFRVLEGRSLDEVRRVADDTRFDHYCWDLYAKVTDWYEADETHVQERQRTLRDLEHGQGPAASMAAFIADRIVRCHLATMDRLNVEYDLLSWEGDILRLDFWARAFDILKDAGAVYLQTDGPHAGCWVMTIDDGPTSPSDDASPPEEARAKVIVRSDGTVTYVGKDIAYQLWKFGLLDKSFWFHPFETQRSGRLLWSTTSVEPESSDRVPPGFGQASAVYNVIDTRQTYLQQLLQQSLRALGHPQEAERSIHFSYEMVALSHATARALGYDTRAMADRPFVEVSGRKGLGVKADDLLDRLEQAAAVEVRSRNPTFTDEEVRRIAGMIAVAAVRYFMIKFSRGKVIAFDIDEALSFEGESGPYLQYAAVRAGNILQKLEAKFGVDDAGLVAQVGTLSPDALNDPDGTDLWALVLEASRLDEVTDQALRTLELSALAKYTFGLAQRFNAFYHRYPVLKEANEEVRLWRAIAVLVFRAQLTRALDLMGCEVPPRM